MPQPFGCPLRRHSGNIGTNKVFIHFGIYKFFNFATSSTLGPFWILWRPFGQDATAGCDFELDTGYHLKREG